MPGHHRLQGHGKFQSLEQDKNAVIICNVIEGPPESSLALHSLAVVFQSHQPSVS